MPNNHQKKKHTVPTSGLAHSTKWLVGVVQRLGNRLLCHELAVVHLAQGGWYFRESVKCGILLIKLGFQVDQFPLDVLLSEML